MIRYLLKDDVYYSLNDVTSWLVRKAVLTQEQSLSYQLDCKTYISTKLAEAYKQKRVYQHLEPLIFLKSDYFVHWIVWTKLLALLPLGLDQLTQVDRLGLWLGNPETVYFHPNLKAGIQLIDVTAKGQVAAMQQMPLEPLSIAKHTVRGSRSYRVYGRWLAQSLRPHYRVRAMLINNKFSWLFLLQ